MAALVPAFHVLPRVQRTWMPGISPGMTVWKQNAWMLSQRRFAAPPSPGIDTGPLLRCPRGRLRHRTKPRHDPAPGLGGVDDVVDLEHGRDRDRLAVGVELGDLVAIIGLALLGVGDRLHLLAET